MRLARILALGVIGLAATPSGAMAADSGAYHFFPMSELLGSQPGPRVRSQSMVRKMRYYGGPVLPRIRVVSVIWGNGVNATTVANIGPFFSGLVNSTFVDQLKQYSTNLAAVNGRAGTHQTIGRGVFEGQFKIAPLHRTTALTDTAVQNELKAQIAGKHLPAADQNTLYMVYFPASVTITAGTEQSCAQFAAYHSAAPSNSVGKNIFYSVMPDCGQGFTAQTIASSHEFAEALTDGIPTPGSNPAYPQAWNTSDGYEVGDLCERTRSTLAVGPRRYTVQQVFLNSINKCSMGNYHSP